ncbi:MAG: hypothetical protein ACE5GA_07380 [Candidatus Zixiibacteriota bacterium]
MIRRLTVGFVVVGLLFWTGGCSSSPTDAGITGSNMPKILYFSTVYFMGSLRRLPRTGSLSAFAVRIRSYAETAVG